MAEFMTNLKDLTVEDLTITGTMTVAGVFTPKGGVLVEADDTVAFRAAGNYINSPATGKLKVVAAGTGADDLTLDCTTTASDNITFATDKKAIFRDTAIYANSSTDGQLDLVADVEIQIATVLLDVNSNIDVSGTSTFGGEATFSDDITAGFVNVEEITESRVHYKHEFDEIGAVLASTSMVYYYTGGGTSGTQTIVAAECGEMQLSTTATGSRSSTMIYAGSLVADNDKEWEFKTRVKLDNITNTKMEVGMYVDANDEIVFRFDTAVNAANIYLVTESNNAGEVVTDTTVDLVAGEWIEFSIEVAADDTFEVFINGTEVLNAHVTNIIRDVAFKPWFYVDNKAAAEEKILSIDYVEFSQNRTV